MRLNRVKLVNFGIHELFEEHIHSPVWGIWGLSGSGKSTVLTGIKFALKGEIGRKGETSETFIRHGASKATVEVEFSKGGRRGLVRRTITPSRNTHYLKWDGKEYKSEAKVSAKMQDLMGVNSNALGKAVFVPQGKLLGMLDGTDTEREKLFIDLFLVGFTNNVIKQLDKQIGLITRDMVDLSPAKAELQERLAGLTNHIEERGRELERAPDLNPLIRAVDAWLTMARRHVTEVSEHGTAQAAVTSFIEELRGRYAGIASATADVIHEGLVANLQAATNECEDVRKELDTASTALTRLENTEASLARVSALAADIDDLQRKLDALPAAPEMHVVGEKTELLKKLRDNRPWLVSHRDAQVDYHKAKAACEKARGECTEDAAKLEEELEAFRPEFDRLIAERDLLWRRTLVWSDYAADPTKTCHVCDTPLAETAAIKGATDKDAAFAAYAAAKAAYDAAETRWNQMKQALQLAEHKEKVAAHAAAKLEEDQKTAWGYEEGRQNAGLPTLEEADITIDHLSKWLDEVGRNIENREGWTHDLERKKQEHDLLKAGLSDTQVSGLDELRARKAHLAEAADLLDKKVDAIDADIAGLKNRQERAQETFAKAENTRVELYALRQAAREAEDALGDVELPDRTTGEPVDIETWLEALRELHGQRRELEAKIDVLETEARRDRKALAEIDRRMEAEREKHDMLEKLGKLKELFSRDGLPGLYLKGEFDKLAHAVQYYLTLMNNNFSVSPDPELPVAFQFRREDLGEAVLPQTKLSGGEKMRLGVAFLLAVQHVIAPGVGLLVLDEPSTHLDQPCKDNLRDLLLGLDKMLSGAEWQIVVCDHSDTVEQACGQVSKL